MFVSDVDVKLPVQVWGEEASMTDVARLQCTFAGLETIQLHIDSMGDSERLVK